MTREMKILLITIAVSAFLAVIAILSGDPGVAGWSVILSIFIIATPQFFLRYEKFRELKEMEERFPTFLRDLIESLRSGMPLHKTIISASKINYGKLSKEVKKMSDQISWGMPVDKVLNQFAERVKRSKRLYTVSKLIRETYQSGGDVISILESVADNATILEEAEKEKRSTLSQYVLLMYAIAFIFIAIVAAINKLLVPIFELTEAPGMGFGLTNPCALYVGKVCTDLSCNICGLFQGTARTIFFPEGEYTKVKVYYVSLFFFMAIIQSAFSGLVAGQISENSLLAGLKHSLILIGVTFGAFFLLIRFGMLGI